MDSQKPMDATKAAPVEIDYDHLNVAEIMARIQKSAAEAPPAEIDESAAPREAAPPSLSPTSTVPPPPAPPAPPRSDGNLEPQGAKQKIKKIVRKLMRPFFPVIRLLAFPIHEELRATIKSLHETNVRLDNLDRLLQQQAEKYDQGLQRLETTFNRKMDAAGERTDRTELRLDLLEERLKDLDKSMEYIRLLHNLEHNLVVELTKLKVEAETLKSKFRILEKDQEFAQRRERALEEQALK